MKTNSNGLVYKAYYIADKINLTAYKKTHSDHVSVDSTSLYYQMNEGVYLFVLSYGAVVLCGLDDAAIEKYLADIKQCSTGVKEKRSYDQLSITIENAKQSKHSVDLQFETLQISRFDHHVNKMIMMHLAQSVTLDHYNAISQQILREIKDYTLYLQQFGKIKLSHRQALKFIGRSLNTKNSIAENIYILDSPDTAWNDEYLDDLHNMLVRYFELMPRYREIDNTLKIIEDNLDVYISNNHHRESSRLEWIIIILIVIEVIDTFWSKF